MGGVERAAFGQMLRYWRQHRRLSQLELSGLAGISGRHLSFLETGRSSPSREMVLGLAEAMDLPLREHNALLDAAGFSARYSELDFGSPELAQVRRMLEIVLERQEPYPVVVLDRHWNVLMSNQAALRMVGLLLPEETMLQMASGKPLNLVHTIFAHAGLKESIENWEAVAHATVLRLSREAAAKDDKQLKQLLQSVLSMPGVPPAWRVLDLGSATNPFIPLVMSRGELRLNLFTTLSAIGTPLDVTLQELSLETYFPADDETELALERLADGWQLNLNSRPKVGAVG